MQIWCWIIFTWQKLLHHFWPVPHQFLKIPILPVIFIWKKEVPWQYRLVEERSAWLAVFIGGDGIGVQREGEVVWGNFCYFFAAFCWNGFWEFLEIGFQKMLPNLKLQNVLRGVCSEFGNWNCGTVELVMENEFQKISGKYCSVRFMFYFGKTFSWKIKFIFWKMFLGNRFSKTCSGSYLIINRGHFSHFSFSDGVQVKNGEVLEVLAFSLCRNGIC